MVLGKTILHQRLSSFLWTSSFGLTRCIAALPLTGLTHRQSSVVARAANCWSSVWDGDDVDVGSKVYSMPVKGRGRNLEKVEEAMIVRNFRTISTGSVYG